MIEIFSYTVCCDIWVHVTDDQVSGSTITDLVGDVTRKDELAVIPGEFELQIIVSHHVVVIRLGI